MAIFFVHPDKRSELNLRHSKFCRPLNCKNSKTFWLVAVDPMFLGSKWPGSSGRTVTYMRYWPSVRSRWLDFDQVLFLQLGGRQDSGQRNGSTTKKSSWRNWVVTWTTPWNESSQQSWTTWNVEANSEWLFWTRKKTNLPALIINAVNATSFKTSWHVNMMTRRGYKETNTEWTWWRIVKLFETSF